MDVSLEEFSRAIAAIHEASTAPDHWPDALSALANLLHASKAAAFDIDAQSQSIVGLTTVGHDPSAQKAYMEHYFAVDPTMAVGMAMQPHTPATVYEAFPQQLRNRHEYFDFARSVDIGDALAVGTRTICGRRTIISLQRPYDAAAFEPGGSRIMQLIARHFETAKHVEMRFADAMASRAALASSLDCLAVAAFVADGKGVIRHVNAAAGAALARDPRLRVAHGKLSLKNPKLNSAFENALRTASARLPRAVILALPSSGPQPSELTVLPLAPHHELSAHWQVPLALVILAEPGRDAERVVQRMRVLYNLTPAEARVAAALALGGSVEQIAREHSVQESTIRAQIRSIFDKTGVGRQADLVRLALDGISLMRAADRL